VPGRMRMILCKKIALIVIIVVILVVFMVLLFRWLESYSLEIDPDEIYRITWSSLDVRLQEITDRDEIEEIIRYINAWHLVEWRQSSWRGVDTYPPLRIWFEDEVGNNVGNWVLCRTGFLRCHDPNLSGGRHQIIGNRNPMVQFERRFG